MGKIIINIPSDIDKEFTVTSVNDVEEILSLVRKTYSHQPPKTTSLAGIWKDRFANQTGQELQQQWRKELWERY